MVYNAHVKYTVHFAVVYFLRFLSSFFVSFISANPPDLMVSGQAQDLDLEQKDKILMLDIKLIFEVFKIFAIAEWYTRIHFKHSFLNW